MAEFLWRGFQGQAETFQNTLNASDFAGTEGLIASVYLGDTQAAILTLAPAWDVSSAQTTPPTKINTAITAAQFSSLAPGSYAVLMGLASNNAALQKGILTVYPGPGGTAPLFERALATPALAQDILPELTQDQIDWLPFALRSATRAIETYCGRPLVMDSYDHIMRPKGGVTRFRLRAKPLVEISRVAADVISGCIVSNNSTGLSSATMQTITMAPNSLQIKSLVFSTQGPSPTTASILLSSLGANALFSDLATAINLLGNGWGATTNSPGAGIELTDAFGTPGTRGILNENPWIHTHSNKLAWWWDNPDQGFIEVNEPIPGGYLIQNPKKEKSDTRYWGIRFTYRAGFAVSQADIALGYYPVPEDLAAATAMTAYALIESAPMAGPVQTQAVKDRSYTLKDAHHVIPDAAKDMLSRYVEFVI